MRLLTAVLVRDGLAAFGVPSIGIDTKNVYRMCLAGNTTMNHLLLGLYSEPVLTGEVIW